MGKTFENLTMEELCDLMCGGPEEEFDEEVSDEDFEFVQSEEREK